METIVLLSQKHEARIARAVGREAAREFLLKLGKPVSA